MVANRGEIALRVVRSAAEAGIATVAVASADDDRTLHARLADETHVLEASGPAAYLDGAALLQVARDRGCDAVHPGYGFLSESAAFAAACRDSGVVFVGPSPEHLDLLADKASARTLAAACDVPVLDGTPPVDLDQAAAFHARVGGAVMIKAVSGGGGRGIRLVKDPDDLPAAFERCRSEARRSFGDDRVFVERAVTAARHIEVQIAGDGCGGVVELGERDCTVQRRNQKLLEVTPSPAVSDGVRAALVAAARRMAERISFLNLGTFEFLVDCATAEDGPFWFLEANPRLQVEHTVTEEVTGLDLVRLQLSLAAGTTFSALGLDGPGVSRRGVALQARVNAETLASDGTPMPADGTITNFEPPTGPGVRVDSAGHTGYRTNAAFDSLLAKVIVRADSFEAATRKAARALDEFRIDGVATNIPFLKVLLAHPMLASMELSTRFVDENLTTLLEQVGADEPAAVAIPRAEVPEGAVAVMVPITGQVTGVTVAAGETVCAGQELLVVEAMKMEHAVTAPVAGTVERVDVRPGTGVSAGQVVAVLMAVEGVAGGATTATVVDPDHVRPDLEELLRRKEALQDRSRPDAVTRRRAKGARTARENIDALCDAGTFVEYGGLVVAAQRRRRTVEELIRKTPADGLIAGFGAVNGSKFGLAAASTCVLAFDETVLAGTMGEMARQKFKRCVHVAEDARTPVVLFAEGGGGRAGDTDGLLDVTGWTLDVEAYHAFGRLSGLVPLVGVVAGRCFAANAGLLGSCDVIIATASANIGVGGPSMVEGGRLGSYTAEEIGPMAVQVPNGVVDVVTADEAGAAAVAKQYLGYFQGPVATWDCDDQRALRSAVPENRLRAYDVRRVVHGVADSGSILELRSGFGVGMITALARIEGRPVGVVANNPLHLGGAIDADAADKASRFMRLCEAFDLPILLLCDTPGVMVGPEAEKEATVRKMGRMFVTGANLTVPFFTVVLRKAYGIGAELMAGGWFRAPRFTIGWPTAELGGMNIEGNVKLAHAAELAAIEDAAEREARFQKLVAELYEVGRALSVATHYELDDVIDPAETRGWVSRALATHVPASRHGKRIPFVDPW